MSTLLPLGEQQLEVVSIYIVLLSYTAFLHGYKVMLLL